MLQTVTFTPSRRTLEFGIYRDGDNNLDAIQETVVSQAIDASARDSRIQFTVEDTTATHRGTLRQARGDIARREPQGGLHTDEFAVADGRVGHAITEKAHDMSDETNLAQFVAKTLDNAEASGAKQTWIELVDHGGGDGGGLQTSDGACMSMPDIAKAISDGVAIHAKAHPEDADRNVDGVVANQCLMATMGFADALSRAGVKWLAASPETMVAPGVPTGVAEAIASHEDDPSAMARAVVGNVMRSAYDSFFGPLRPAAAFDVLDLGAAKIAHADSAIKRFNDLAATAAGADPDARCAIKDDLQSVPGMVRFPQGKSLPWRADRPAISAYDAVTGDARLANAVRNAAGAASAAVKRLVLAHKESAGFDPFDGADYRDAAGPTVHLPTSHRQIDPWAKNGVTETKNAFYDAVDQGKLVRAIA